jgi:hypothetical protein
MALWPYSATGIAADVLVDAVRVSRPAARYTVVGRGADTVHRRFRVSYNPVSSAEVRSMSAFFAARRGAFETFTFPSPIDDRLYSVRFVTDMRIENFTPAYFRTNVLEFDVVTGIAVSSEDAARRRPGWGQEGWGMGAGW